VILIWSLALFPWVMFLWMWLNPPVRDIRVRIEPALPAEPDPAPPWAPVLKLLFSNGISIQGGFDMAQIRVDQKVVASVAGKDAKGNPVAPAAVAWSVSDANIFAVQPQPDGTAVITPVGALGSAVLTAAATGAEGQVVNLSVQIDVTAGALASGEIVLSAPQPL